MGESTVQGSRNALDRERLVRVALELLDEVGLDDLSMRRVAERLGVTAASLYWYVQDKNELLTLLADAISAEVPLPDSASPWRMQLEEGARSLRRVVLAHRDAARVLAVTAPTGPHRLRVIDALLGLLSRAGFPPADVADAGYILNVYIVGFMLDETLGPRSPQTSLSKSDVSRNTLAHGCLILERGATNFTVRGDSSLPTLYEMTFEGRPPEVEAQEGTVRVRQRHERRGSCDLKLAGAIGWEIQVDGGALRLAADLRDLSLSSLHISGGVSQAMLQLPKPVGAVPVRIDGGVNKLRIERPPGSAIKLRLNRGSSRITLDGLRLGAAGGGTDWESPEYATTSDCYNLEMGADVNELTIATTAVEPTDSASDDTTLNAHTNNWFADQPSEEYPNLVALSSYLAQLDLDRCFELGLELLLDGLERRLAASGRSSHSLE